MDHVLSVSREKHLSRILCCAIAGLFAFTGSVHAGQRVTDPGLSLRDSAVGILTFENLSQISSNRDFVHRISNLSILNPKTIRASGIITVDNIYPRTNQTCD